MQFTTPVHWEKPDKSLTHESSFICLGSCFAQHISDFLLERKFKVYSNPFGIIYNPYSINKLIQRSLNSEPWTEEDFVHYDGSFLSLDTHGSLKSQNLVDLQSRLEKLNQEFLTRIKKADVIIISLGSSFVYRYVQTGKIVANCHKIPSKAFTKELLTVQEVSDCLKEIISSLRNLNGTLKFILTVSPIRHIRDGLIQNSRSKSHLISALHQAVDEFETDYFPSYEWLMDELRDYRFYAEDMIHPSKQAIDYICKNFSEAYFTEATRKLIQEIERIKSSANHRLMTADCKKIYEFANNSLKQIDKLQTKYPKLNFDKEIQHFKAMLAS